MAIERYNPKQAESRWQRQWDEAKIYQTDNASPDPKYYVLEMFPYPSGRIHMGHVRNYALGDVVARYKRARGFNVLHPMGWDAFGMPAENAAIQNKVHPREWTYANIDAMRKQLKSMGLSLDWSREFATCDVDYYKQQQALFLDFLAAGLIYRRNSKVNWDPVDMTVLANEQVIDGRGWRSGALVEQRELTQWFFRISDFAEDLLQSLDELDQWPEKVRLMQKNWIGKSEGLSLRWEIARSGTRWRRDRDRGLHHTSRHALWRILHGDCRRSPDCQGSGSKGSGNCRVLRSVPPRRNLAGSARNCRKDWLQHAGECDPPA
jgi:leucyl-tRNA synthetase